MLKLLKIISLSIISLVFMSSNAFAVSAEDVKACDGDTHLFTGTATACRFTPQSYKANVFEMGLCTVNPMSGAALDRATCTKVFTATGHNKRFCTRFCPWRCGSSRYLCSTSKWNL